MVGSLWEGNTHLEMVALADFIMLAEQDTDKSWSKVDSHLPAYCDKPTFISWAKENLFNENYALRDLAASTLVLSKTELSQQDIDNLTKLMDEEYEENPYPSFRAALALAKRVSDQRITSLSSVIRKRIVSFLEDDTVWDIAKKALEEMY